MPSKKPGRAVASVKSNTNLAKPDQRFAIGDTEIHPLQLYRNPERHPGGAGPWSDEPDKIAWVDAETGLSCIILRQANGTLGGYVAVAPSHPLWGFAYDAIPAGLDITAHCGLDYSESCREYEREAIAICHVSERRRSGRSHPGGRQQNTADDTWWFGFGCDKPGDLVPDGYKPPLHREEGEVYRSIDYVYEETHSLARSLKAIEDGPTSSAGVPLMLGAPDKDTGKA